mgnify:CR=1 FL=1
MQCSECKGVFAVQVQPAALQPSLQSGAAKRSRKRKIEKEGSGAPGVPRALSAYNVFMKAEVAKVKGEHPELPHREAFQRPPVGQGGVTLRLEIKAHHNHRKKLATQNAANNGLDERVTFVRGDVSRKGGVLPARSFDHVISNPPYIAETSGRRSGSQHADLSKRESEVTLAEWIEAMLYWVKERGHITIIHRADRLHEIIEALTPRIGGLRVCPVWPKPGREANRVVVQGRREAKAGLSLLPGITVRDQDDRVTPEMERIQRYGHGLDF